MSVVVTAALGGAAVAWASPATVGLPAALAQTKPSRLSSALYSGIECYRRGEYEQAASFFQQAQAGRDSLPAETRQELDKYLKLNDMALQARKDGRDQLLRAEAASAAGRAHEAATLLKGLTTNPFLSPEDHQKALKLNSTLVTQVSKVESGPTDGGTILEARAKVRQGREFLNKYMFTPAETLAREAAKMHVTWTAGEDTPLKLLDDVGRMRQDPKILLQGARAALTRGDYDDAEKLATMAEKQQGIARKLWPIGDSPSKVRKDIAAARRGVPVKNEGSSAPVATPTSNPKDKEPAKVESFKKNLINWMTPGKPDPKNDGTPDGSVGQATPKPTADTKPTTHAKATKETSIKTVSGEVVNAAMPVGDAKVTPAPTAATNGKRSSIPNDEAHKLLKEARKALAENRVEDARKLLTRARETKTTYSWNEYWWDPDQPDKVEADLRRAEAKRNGGDTVAKRNGGDTVAKRNGGDTVAKRNGGDTVAKVAAPVVDSNKPMTRDEARAQLKKARDMMKTGKLDEATRLACQVRAVAPKGSWGLFDDSPEKVVLDVRKMKDRRDREESERLLAQARKALQEGHLEEARAKATRAEELHGPYNVWEFGDRPQRLLSEVAVAETKSRRGKPTPESPKPDTVVAQAPMSKPIPAPAPVPTPTPTQVVKSGGPTPTDQVPPLSPPGAVADARLVEARKLLADARVATRAGDLELATKLATQVQMMGVAQDRLGNDTPDAVLQEIMRLREPAAGTAMVSLPPKPPATDPITIHARELVVEARRLQAEGKLVEAREKALEAQKFAANFQADEDRPERALLELAGLAQKRIENLMTAANDAANPEEILGQAHQLAVGFALDTQPIDAKRTSLRPAPAPEPTIAQAPVVVPPTPPVTPPLSPSMPPSTPPGSGTEEASAPPVPPDQQGLRLLDQARVEITKGNTATARKLAEEAFKGPYGGPVQAQAEFVLHSIDAEEFNQRRNQANRSFDAALSAYHRKDLSQARGILAAVDVTLLDRDKALRYKEIMRAPEMNPPAVAQVSDHAPGAAHVNVTDDPGTQKSMPTDPGTQKSMPTGDNNAKDNNNFAAKVAGLQEIQFQHMREEGLKAQRDAIESMRRGEADRALEILNAYLDDLGRTNLDPNKAAMLRRGVESRAQQFSAAREQMLKATADKDRADTFKTMMNSKVQADEQKRELVKQQMKQYNDLFKAGKYREAELCAAKAHEIDPDNVAASAGMHIAKMAGRKEDYRELKGGKEELVLRGLNDTDDEGPHLNIHKPMSFSDDFGPRTKNRRGMKDLEFNSLRSEKDREIERRLMNPISFQFENKPLKKVLEEIGDLSGINVVPDIRALNEKGISLDLPMTQKLEGISLKSALNIVLDQAKLTYVIKNEVLTVTTPERARGGMQSKTYQVADLVVPIENYTVGGHADLQNVTDKINNTRGGFVNSMTTPYTGTMSLTNGTNVGTPANGEVSPGTVSPGATTSGSVANQPPSRSPLPIGGAMASKNRAPGQTMEEVLINLIVNTIEPNSWE
jgi:hypothetical protein